jgi:hypothetical protein
MLVITQNNWRLSIGSSLESYMNCKKPKTIMLHAPSLFNLNVRILEFSLTDVRHGFTKTLFLRFHRTMPIWQDSTSTTWKVHLSPFYTSGCCTYNRRNPFVWSDHSTNDLSRPLTLHKPRGLHFQLLINSCAAKTVWLESNFTLARGKSNAGQICTYCVTFA